MPSEIVLSHEGEAEKRALPSVKVHKNLLKDSVPYTVSIDRVALADFYRDNGFSEKQIADTKIELRDHHTRLDPASIRELSGRALGGQYGGFRSSITTLYFDWTTKMYDLGLKSLSGNLGEDKNEVGDRVWGVVMREANHTLLHEEKHRIDDVVTKDKAVGRSKLKIRAVALGAALPALTESAMIMAGVAKISPEVYLGTFATTVPMMIIVPSLFHNSYEVEKNADAFAQENMENPKYNSMISISFKDGSLYPRQKSNNST